MAEDQEDRSSDDLSEEASPYKIEEFRKKGRVAQSREVSGVLALLAAGTMIYVISPFMGGQAAGFMQDIFSMNFSTAIDLAAPGVLRELAFRGLKTIGSIFVPIAFAAFLLGAIGSFAQIGAIFSTEPLTPNLEKIDPIKGAKRFLSLKQLYDGIRLIIRMVIIVLIAYVLVKTRVLSSPELLVSEPPAILTAYQDAARVIFYSLMAVLAVFAGFDFWLQRWEYGKSVRLTKKEAKEEHKEREGDPMVKARIRSIQREVARRRMMEAIKTADVIVTNPTHIAVAIQYDKDEMAAPKVVAKGADFLAQKIKKIGADADVPLVENVPLARALYKSVKVGQFVPRALYQAIAEVLAYVYRLKNRGV